MHYDHKHSSCLCRQRVMVVGGAYCCWGEMIQWWASIPKQSIGTSKSNKVKVTEKVRNHEKKDKRHGWMRSLLICLTHSLHKWEWMVGFLMPWLEDGWVCSYGFNWLKTGIQLEIIESWKSLKAQVHEIIRRANQVVINAQNKSSLGYRLKGAYYLARFQV